MMYKKEDKTGYVVEGGYTLDDEFVFNCWFCDLLTEVIQVKHKTFMTEANTIDEVAKYIGTDEIEFMCELADWDRDYIIECDKRNIIYWYCLRLLFLYNDGEWQDNLYFNYEALYCFLDSITPYGE